MKISSLPRIVIAGLTVAAFSLTACNNAKDDTADKDTGTEEPPPPKKEEETPPKKIEEDPKPVVKEDTTPKTPEKVVSSSSGGVAKKLNGYWALDADSIKTLIGSRLGETEDGKPNPMAEMIAPFLDSFDGKVVLELDNGKSKHYLPKLPSGGLEVEEGTYEITESDDSKGTFTAELVDGKGKQEGKGMVTDDTLTMATDNVKMTMNRLSKGEFDKRLKEIETFVLDPKKLIEDNLDALKDLIPKDIKIPEGVTIPKELEDLIPKKEGDSSPAPEE